MSSLSEKLIERRNKNIPQGPFNTTNAFIKQAAGACMTDVDGKKYIDFAGGIGVNNVGHSHPKVVKAIQEQAEKFIHISSDFYHEKWIELSEKLAAIAPFEEEARVFLTNSGTEAVEAAITLARYKPGRSGFIGFLGGFHGRTMGSLAFTASKAKYKRGFGPVMDGVIHAPFPDTYRPLLARRAGEGYGETVVRYIEEEIMGRVMPADEIAGIVIEPIQGEGGYIIPPPEFFPALRELCDKHGILLIADEVQAGMGRTGKWWSIENFGVEPDIVTSAKGIASGVPLGAMIARKSVMTWTVGTHGNTYGGNPLACAAACETIDLIGESFMQNAAKVGEYALDALEEIAAHHPSIGDVRGKGLMIGVDFVKDQETREPASAFRDRVSDLAFERGVITLGCGESTIRVSPPLNITKAEIDEGLRAFDEAIGIAEKE